MYTNVKINICIYVSTSARVCVRVCMCVCVCMCGRVCIDTYLYEKIRYIPQSEKSVRELWRLTITLPPTEAVLTWLVQVSHMTGYETVEYIYETWFVQMWDVTHSNARHDSFRWKTWLLASNGLCVTSLLALTEAAWHDSLWDFWVHIWDMTHSDVRHDSLPHIASAWHASLPQRKLRNVTRHETVEYTCETWLIQASDMTPFPLSPNRL